ncbi:deoxyribose-phosphate aldolase, partial [bacterium]|nr:deoxyribose-phosphate aldolase [bacterium]
MIDHTALKPETTPDQIRQLCREAREYKFASVCLNPGYVKLAASELQGSNIPVCSVIGFPLGNNSMELKALETRQAVAAGAREIDMVIHVGQLKAGNIDYVRQDIESVVEAAAPEAIVKVILETCLLTDAEIVTACELAATAGAHFVKTSTGFSTNGAT